MRKVLLVLIAAVLVAAMAMPAMAGMTASGFYRAKSYISNFKGTAGSATSNSAAPGLAVPTTLSDDPETSNFIEQRARIKLEFGEENVKMVWFTEHDITAWGDSAGNEAPGTDGAARNVGGSLGGDKINTETKNLYIWFKLPNTSLDFTVGLQGQPDAYAGILYNTDFAGIFMNGKFDPVAYKLGFGKLYENETQETDDMDLYVAEVKFSPTKELNLGVNFYYLVDDTQKAQTGGQTADLPNTVVAAQENTKEFFTPGFNVAYQASWGTISGFFFYQFGTIEFRAAGAEDVDVEGYAADVRADLKLGPGNFFIEGLYISGGDQSGANPDYESPVSLAIVGASPGGDSAYSRTRMEILLANADAINNSQCLIGCSGGVASPDLGNGGRGIWHVAAGYSQKLTDKVTGAVNVGYLAATELLESDETPIAAFSKDEEMGAEINASLNYNIMKGLDVGVVGAYAMVGDFFKPNASDDPEDLYDLHARINYSF